MPTRTKTKVSTRHRVYSPGEAARWQTQGRHSTNRRVIYIKTACRPSGTRTLCEIKGKWAPSSEAPKRVTLRPGERLEPHVDRLFQDFKEGQTSGIPPVRFAILSKSVKKGWDDDPAAFLAAVRGLVVSPGANYARRAAGHVYGQAKTPGKPVRKIWMKRVSHGTRGETWTPANLPTFWVVPMPDIGADGLGGIVLYDATAAPPMLSWPRARRPAPWNRAISVETPQEVEEAVKRLVAPFAALIYDAPTGRTNRRRWSWPRLIRRLS